MGNFLDNLSRYSGAYDPQLHNVLLTVLIVALLFFFRKIVTSIITKNTKDPKTIYHAKRIVGYVYGFLLIILISSVWIEGFSSIGTYLGIISAGLAIALHETIANIAGWFFIVWKKPFVVGDRIQIGDTKGDVVDLRLFQFSMVEVGNWVAAEQSTGRIIHVPNSQVLKERTANYHGGFNYIWNEIQVLVTFESDWRKIRALLEKIAEEKIGKCPEEAQRELLRAASNYMIHFNKLTPAVYMTTRDSGILFSLRYIVDPRQKRGSEQAVWEEILTEFEKDPDMDLAYPTTRFYSIPPEGGEYPRGG